MKKIIATLIIGLTLMSCAEDSPQELRAKAKKMEAQANQIEETRKEEAKRRAERNQYPIEAMRNLGFSGVADGEVFYIDGHKCIMWGRTRGHGECLAIMHDPECEMNDIRKIVRP